MGGGSIVRHDCGRLIIRGQRCICAAPLDLPCDCEPAGNRSHFGPTCRQREREAWSAAVGRAKHPITARDDDTTDEGTR